MKKILAVFLCLPLLAEARPVSYPSGWTTMLMNDMEKNSLHVHYSPTFKTSVGYKAEFWREDEWHLHGIQVNHLLKRWNKKHSQANVYVKGLGGVAFANTGQFDGKREAAGAFEFATDWEDRRYFTSYAARATYAGDIDKFFMQKARVGIAPYIGDYGDLHTWLMLQVEHNPKESDPIKFTPLVRMFKGVHLAEFGVNEDGDAMVNWVIRF